MKLQELVAQYLTALDPVFSEGELPLRYRPLEGALAFVEDEVIKVSHGRLEEPIGQPWFDAIHYEVLRWYHERYGEAMIQGNDDALGVVLLYGAPIRLSIPLTVTRPGSQPTTFRLSFPDSVRDDEEVDSFVQGRLGLDTFDDDAKRNFRSRVVAIVCRTRQIGRGFHFADLSETARAFVDRAMMTLRQSVESLTANSPGRLGSAIWELNMTAELALKIFLMQRKAPFRKIHIVHELNELAVVAGLPALDEDVLRRFPSKELAIQHRYGEIDPPSLGDAIELYDATLALVLNCAANCTSQFRIAPDGWIEVRAIGAFGRTA